MAISIASMGIECAMAIINENNNNNNINNNVYQ
jgi:hypothetical protein